ncbi:MAG: hypothetical protein NC218_04260 [Acetobacter sp.]|nr:hypothetical protein [Acetobacter sp.]
MNRAGTKTTLKRQTASKQKMDNVYKEVQKFTKDKKVADKLIEKYGVESAYAIVRQCMQEPGNVMKRVNPQSTLYKTSDAIKYFANTNLNDVQVAKGIKKTSQFVANSKKSKNNTPKAQASQAKVETRTTVRKTTKTKSNISKGYNRSQAKAETRRTLLEQSSAVKTLTPITRPNTFDFDKIVEQSSSTFVNITGTRIPVLEKVTLTPEQQAEQIYNNLAQTHKGDLSIEELMKSCGVNRADIQDVFEENKDYFAKLEPGKNNKNLATKANKVSGRCEGGCLAGVQRMCPELGGENPNWRGKKEYNSSANSACNAPEVLEKGGKYVTVEVDNLAFGRGAGSPEDRKMKEFNKTLPAGTIAALDNYKPEELHGRRPQNNSQKHGHVWVQDEKGDACSDGRQPDGPNFSRYGRKMFVCVAKDCRVPKKIAVELIKRRQEREQESEKSILYAKANQQGR